MFTKTRVSEPFILSSETPLKIIFYNRQNYKHNIIEIKKDNFDNDVEDIIRLIPKYDANICRIAAIINMDFYKDDNIRDKINKITTKYFADLCFTFSNCVDITYLGNFNPPEPASF